MTELTMQCPTCSAKLTWDTDNPHRPFCCAGCKDRDFIGWSNEERTIAIPDYALLMDE